MNFSLKRYFVFLMASSWAVINHTVFQTKMDSMYDLAWLYSRLPHPGLWTYTSWHSHNGRISWQYNSQNTSLTGCGCTPVTLPLERLRRELQVQARSYLHSRFQVNLDWWPMSSCASFRRPAWESLPVWRHTSNYIIFPQKTASSASKTAVDEVDSKWPQCTTPELRG